VEFGRERLVQRRAILLSPQCGDTTSCIRHLVSDRRLSLISKENVSELTTSQLVAITTRSDTGSHNRLDLIQSLVPRHYVYNRYLFLETSVLCTIYQCIFRNIHAIHELTMYFSKFQQISSNFKIIK
jgi:hypothetical protein